jgi:probable HAF family extracellular repeat protein
MQRLAVLAACCVLLGIAQSAHAAEWSFQGLGELPGGDFYSTALGISADGSTVVGVSTVGSVHSQAFRWTKETGMVGLGYLFDDAYSSGALGASSGGSVVVGRGQYGSIYQAFRWSSGEGMVRVSESSYPSFAYDVSADGSMIVGGTRATSAGQFLEAFLWTADGGTVGLGDLEGGGLYSYAAALSPDGSVIVGIGRSSQGYEAFRWTSLEGMIGLGDLAKGDFQSNANAVSADGAVVVGAGTSASGVEAFRWTNELGMVGLGDLPGGEFRSYADGVSADGSVIVGTGSSALGDSAFYWTEATGMIELQELLLSGGVTAVTGWTLNAAAAISADGRIIVGRGINPDGFDEAWIAIVPEPTSDCLALCASIVVVLAFFSRKLSPGR